MIIKLSYFVSRINGMCNTMKFPLLITDLAPPELVPVSDDAYCDAELENQRRNSGTAKTFKGVRQNRKSKDKVTSMKGELYEAVKLQNITHIQKIEQDPVHSAVSPSDKTLELNKARNYPHGMAIEAPDAEFSTLIPSKSPPRYVGHADIFGL